MYFSFSKFELKKNRQAYENMYDKNHLVVQIDKTMNWNYVYSLLKPLYSEDKGRPSLDPLMLVKILIIQYIEGFRSVRFTCKQIEQHITYRWFLGLSKDDSVPCHSSVSKFLRHRVDPKVWEALFECVLLQIQKEGFLSPETWAADETELKANANKRKRVKVMEKEDEDVLQLLNQKRLQHGKKPLSPKPPKEEGKEVLFSTTDPDAGLSVKHDPRGRFAFHDHRIVETLHHFILDAYVTSANVPGHRVLLERIERVKQRIGYVPEEIVLDAGYYNARLGRGLEKKGIGAYISYLRFHRKEHPKCRSSHFRGVKEDVYVGPCGVEFTYSTSTRAGYHEYKPVVKGSCTGCPAAKGKGDRVLRISVHQEVYEQMRKRRLSERGQILRLVRPATIERSFAESKELHGLRFARYRGVPYVQIQVWITAMIQNLKKWIKLRSLQSQGIDLSYHK
ncbi:IS1182 family transposase [Anoxybacteroides tepidamans]|uniref:IS1182 family transposase n=1 Tax=Anoxybacteroides tepidamans TaxID=265948 RepID=UPI0004856A57|nr:IS1182 family transposase [Anoxybacillus tepidamans]